MDLRDLEKLYEEAVEDATARGVPNDIAGCDPSFLAIHAVAALPIYQRALMEILEIAHNASQDSSDSAYVFIERLAHKALQGEKL